MSPKLRASSCSASYKLTNRFLSDQWVEGAAHNFTFLSTLAVAKTKASPSPVEEYDDVMQFISDTYL